MQLRPSFVEIHLSALRSNYLQFAGSDLGKHFMCPMVKANAYGHGDLQITQHLEKLGCSRFGVGLVEEGVRLREKGHVKSEVLVFGFTGKSAVEEILHHQLTPVVSDFGQLEQLISSSSNAINIHLKFNTGMNRLGFLSRDVSALFDQIAKNKKIKVVGLCTHLMTSEDLLDAQGSSMEQLSEFEQIVKTYAQPHMFIHAYNSSGAARAFSSAMIKSKYPYGLRTGLGLYGLLSCDSDLSRSLCPVMRLKSTVVAVQPVKKGKSVSYGGTWTATQDSVVGIVPMGYADGIPTQLSNRGSIVIDQKSYPIIGRVCMDYTLIDVTNLPQPMGRSVEFFGEQTTAVRVAENAATICYDVLTRISERVPRVFVGEAI